MKLNLYAIFDQESGVFDGPFKARTDGEVKRMFIDICGDAEHPIGKHPEHYTLVKVGVWNDGTGTVDNLQNHTMLTGLEALSQGRKVTNIKEAGNA